jgi:methionyl-tRNA formyltransferase
VRELAKVCNVVGAILETTGITPTFDVGHPYLLRQTEYEQEVLLGGDRSRIDDILPCCKVGNINDQAAVAALQSWSADLTVAFGVRRIRTDVIRDIPGTLLNLHGGNPAKYRGLDSHLWAIYHSDFDSLMTTLHILAPDLDTGDIITQGRIPLHHCMPLHELRAKNTRVCLDLVLASIQMIRHSGQLEAAPQQEKGRYYSLMPGVLKEIVAHRFERFTEEIP